MSTEWDVFERNQLSTYKDFVDACNKVGLTMLPPRKPVKTSIQGAADVNAARDAVFGAQTETVSTTQAALRDAYDEAQEKRFHNLLGGWVVVDKVESTSATP